MTRPRRSRTGVGRLSPFCISLIAAWPFFASAESFKICAGPLRISCVVDGDTLWIDGEKIRLSSIDAPEVEGLCPRERASASLAARRLADLLAHGEVGIVRRGTDPYGRTLAVITVDGMSVGNTLVNEGLARRWAGRRQPWC